jgi:uncharacterized protein DUF6055/flagellar hook capping protein FlgD
MKYYILLFILLAMIVHADDFENYLNYRAGLEEYKGDVKCATKYETQLRFLINNPDKLSNNKLQLISLTAPSRTDSLKTEHFTLHWDESGFHSVTLEDLSSNGIPDYIDTAAVVLEHVWDVEINQMNYSPPPQQNGQPVANYHVYFTDMAYYGGTTGSGNDIPSLPGTNWTSYLELENDYQESYFFSQGLDGLRVTAAHEFHHAIQFGYNVRQEDYFFYEMTSTWMEDVLYTHINDYYNYLSSLFTNLGNRSFDNFSLYAYGNCLYVHMLEKHFGSDIVRDIWNQIKSNTVIDALAIILPRSQYNSNWLTSLADYGVWLYFTGNRSNSALYFPEGEFYPEYHINSNSTHFLTDSLIFENNVLSNSFKYYKIVGAKDKAVFSILDASNSIKAGHQLFTTTSFSEFSTIGTSLNNFVINEDSTVAIVVNAENLDDNFIVNIKVLTNFVQIDSLIVNALPGRNLLTWSSSFESLLKEYRLGRKIPNENFQDIYIVEGNEYSNHKIEYSFSDENIEEGIQYEYKLDAEFQNGNSLQLDIESINSLEPIKFRLLQNNPNPFNNETSIIVEILNNTEYELVIYNALGQKVKTLQKKSNMQAGFYVYKWAGDNDIGKKIASGVYYALLESNNKLRNVKIILIK